jgi:hypothetical protein
MNMIASTSSEEEANDAGEGKGGRWTNFFFARGVKPGLLACGVIVKGVGAAGQEPPSQTSHGVGIRLFPKTSEK